MKTSGWLRTALPAVALRQRLRNAARCHALTVLVITLIVGGLKNVQAIPIEIDLGPSGVISGIDPKRGPIGFSGLNGTPLVGNVSVDFLFANSGFVRIFTATEPQFEAKVILQVDDSGFLGFLSGTGYLIDVQGNAIPGFGVTGSAAGKGLLNIGLFPLLKDKDGTPNDQLQRPFDFYGVHYDIAFPSNPSVEVTSGQFLLSANSAFSPFGIGPGNIPTDIVPDKGATFSLLVLSSFGLLTCRRQLLRKDASSLCIEPAT